MTYDQILTIDAIVKTGSFRAASELLNKTQPSLSIAIQKIEQEFNITLFDRSNYRPILTNQGKIFYQKAKACLISFSKLETLGKELGKGVEPNIKISIEIITPIEKFKEIFQNFNLENQNSYLDISIDVLEGSLEKLLNYEVDFAISPLGIEDDQIESIYLFNVCMIPVALNSYGKNFLSSNQKLMNLPQIIIKSTTSSDNFKSSTLSIKVEGKKLYLNDSSLKKEFIIHGLGWGRLPHHKIEKELKSKILTEINLPSISKVEVPIYLMKNKNHPFGPLTKKLWLDIIKNNTPISNT